MSFIFIHYPLNSFTKDPSLFYQFLLSNLYISPSRERLFSLMKVQDLLQTVKIHSVHSDKIVVITVVPKGADGMTNSAHPDQKQSDIPVCPST